MSPLNRNLQCNVFIAKQDEDTKMAVILYIYSEMAYTLCNYNETKKKTDLSLQSTRFTRRL